MNITPPTENILEPPPTHWVSRAAFPILAATFFLNQAALGTALYFGSVWFSVVLVLTARLAAVSAEAGAQVGKGPVDGVWPLAKVREGA